METSVSQLMLMWRQIKSASGESTGFTLEEVEALDKLRKKVGIVRDNKAIRQSRNKAIHYGTRTKRNP